MIALLLYAYCTGIYSSRRIARATYQDIPFRVLAGESHPHFTTINEFRLVHLEALKALFLEVLKLCQKAGLVRLGHVALDGSKVQANASKHKAMTYERMAEEEKRLSLEIEELLERARTIDQEEDERLGVERLKRTSQRSSLAVNPALPAFEKRRLRWNRMPPGLARRNCAGKPKSSRAKRMMLLWIGWSRSERELEPRRQERRLTSSNHPQTQLNEMMDGRIIAFLQMWTAHRGPTLRGTSPTQTAGSC